MLFLNYRSIKLKFNKLVVKEIGSYSLILGISGLFYFLSSRVDILFIGHFNYITEIGYYEINYKILLLLLVPFTIIGQVIAPDITRNFSNKNYTLLKKNFKKYILFSLIMSFLFIIIFIFIRDYLFSHFLVKYYTGDMKHLSNWMLPFYFTAMLIEIIAIMAIATGHAKFCMYFIIVVGFINVVFDYIFIKYFGFWGLIYSTIIIKSVSYLLFIYLYYKILSRYETTDFTDDTDE